MGDADDDFSSAAAKDSWVPQQELLSRVLPLLRERGACYEKFREILARHARRGERIVSRTSDGVETENTAAADDYIVRNETAAGEEYIVGAKKFEERYEFLADAEDGWARYRPRGKVHALIIDDALLSELGQPDSFFIEAPWGEAQRARRDDYLVTPPDYSEIYRIARAEFRETYRPAD